MENIAKQLEELGLDRTEAQIYAAVLGQAQSTMVSIVKASGVKRTTAYRHIDDLLAKGLIKQSVKGKRVVYIAEDPKIILKDLEQRRVKAERLLPGLSALYVQARNTPRVTFHEGKKSIRAEYDAFFQTHKPIVSTFSAEKLLELFSEEELLCDMQIIYENGADVRMLIEKSRGARIFQNRTQEHETEFVKILPGDFPVTIGSLITGDKVMLTSLPELFAVVIESRDIADYLRNVHRFMWKALG